MAINPHRLVTKTQQRGVGPKRGAKAVGPPNYPAFSDIPDPEVAGELVLVIQGDASLLSDASQLARLYVAVDLNDSGSLSWVRAQLTVSGQDSRTGRSWNHLSALQKGA